MSVTSNPDGGVTMAFTLELESISENYDVIWATGELNSDRSGLRAHSFNTRNSGTLNFETSLADVDTPSTLHEVCDPVVNGENQR